MAAFHPSCPKELYEYKKKYYLLFPPFLLPSLSTFFLLSFLYFSFQGVHFCDCKDKRTKSLKYILQSKSISCSISIPKMYAASKTSYMICGV